MEIRNPLVFDDTKLSSYHYEYQRSPQILIDVKNLKDDVVVCTYTNIIMYTYITFWITYLAEFTNVIFHPHPRMYST